MSLIGRGAIGKIPTVSCISNVSMGKPNNICNNSICMKIVNLCVYPETKTRQQSWKTFRKEVFGDRERLQRWKRFSIPGHRVLPWKVIGILHLNVKDFATNEKWIAIQYNRHAIGNWHLKSIFGRNYFWTTLTNTLCHTGRLDNLSSKFFWFKLTEIGFKWF